MTLKHHFRMTASEIAMGRVMRAPDHTAADDEFAQAFKDFGKDEPAAGAADDKGGGDGKGAGDPAGDGPAGAAGDSGDGAGATDGGAAAAAADDKSGAGAAAGAEGDGADAAPDGKTKPDAGDGDGAAAAAGADAGAAAEAAAAATAVDKDGKKKEPAAAAPAAGETDDDVLKRLAAAVKKVDTEDKPAAETPQDQPLFTQEENAKIEHFRKEWPEVAEAFDLQARALAQSVLKYAFEQIGGVVNPMRETLDILATRTHYGDLKEKVGEYTPEERQEVIDWVGKQPTYLQKPMMSVIEEGTAEEVADLVGRYREATGKKPAGAQAEDKGPQGGDVELSGAAKQAAADLAPVSTKRSAVQAADDKSDYDGAFAKFVDVIG